VEDGVNAPRYAVTSRGRLALAISRLERAWENVPSPTRARLIAAIAAVADDYQPARHERAIRVPLVGHRAQHAGSRARPGNVRRGP
jgi:hypothetical protein